MVDKESQIDSTFYNNKIIISVTILIISLGIIFGGFYFLANYNKPTINKVNGIDKQVQSIIDNCYKSVETKNLEIDPYIKSNITICDNINLTKKENCEFNFYMLKLFDGSISDCEEIKNTRSQNLCIIIKSKDDLKCKIEYQGFEEAICNAIVKNEVNECNSQDDLKIKNTCQNVYYLFKALNTQDSSVCNRIVNELGTTQINSQQKICLLVLEKNDEKYTAEIKNRCENDEIVATLDPAACDYTPEYSSSCKQRIENINNCIKLNDNSSNKMSCIYKEIEKQILCGSQGFGQIISYENQSIKSRILENTPGLC